MYYIIERKESGSSFCLFEICLKQGIIIEKKKAGEINMGVLSHLEPKEVFYYFEEICNIPHPSFKEEKISNYCMEFAKKHELEAYQDDAKNVIIIKEATTGYEDAEPVILQGHLDMVCQKTADREIDFENDPLELEIDGDYIQARGTTLGGDDGIAVAYGLALLASTTISHPRLEVILTTGEEVGLLGANVIDISMCKGKRMINLDSEDEGIFLTGCAGGSSVRVVLPIEREKKEGSFVEVKATGLLGGHSGVEIDKGRANANVLLGTTLEKLKAQCKISLVSFAGGDKDNAIPRESAAQIIINADQKEELYQCLQKWEKEVQEEYKDADPDLRITVEAKGEGRYEAVTEASLEAILKYLKEMPNGIQAMSKDVEGLVETSLNLGTAMLEEEGFCTSFAVRSSVDKDKEVLVEKMKEISSQWNAEVEVSGVYPGWQYRPDSKLREDMVAVFEKMYGKKPVVEAIHAGLECGLFAEKISDIDCVSIGPDMDDIHTTEERLSISSVKRVWEFLLEVLKVK